MDTSCLVKVPGTFRGVILNLALSRADSRRKSAICEREERTAMQPKRRVHKAAPPVRELPTRASRLIAPPWASALLGEALERDGPSWAAYLYAAAGVGHWRRHRSSHARARRQRSR